ncbi:MAG: nucleotide exchange factor GrpE [Evtepia sp.]
MTTNEEKIPETVDESEVLETSETEQEVIVEETKQDPDEAFAVALQEQEDKYLRLAAEYDNFRKRSQREKESAWTDSKAETVSAFFPVYDNLERALKQETSDEAYAKGVQMIMSQLKDILTKLGIEEVPALGETFDPGRHNAVMHVEDETQGANIVVEVLQTGFQAGGKVIRFAMVKVAN